MGKGILLNDGEAWNASRNLMKPLFRRNRADDLELFEGYVDRLIEFLRLRKGEFVDFRRAAQMVVLDTVTEMLCGRTKHSFVLKANDRGRRCEPGLLDLIDELEPYGSLAIELGPLSLPVFVWRYRRIMALIREIQDFFRDAVRDTFHDLKKRIDAGSPTIIRAMLNESLSLDAVQGELQDLFFAAFDTTTALITNLFDRVSRDLALQLRLRAEIDEIAGSGELGETHLSRLILLQATIFETLCVYSPVT